jgi:hypothetical protein
MKVTITHMPTKKRKKRGQYGQNGNGLDGDDGMRDVANIRPEWILQCCSAATKKWVGRISGVLGDL